MKGYTGKILIVDLNTKQTEIQKLPEEWKRDFIGGEGIGVRLFYDYINPLLDPLDAESPIIFATGPLNGTKAPMGGRLSVIFRSPATGGIGLTNVGGHFAPALKKAGYDLLLIKGKADKKVWLKITDKKITIEDASNIWGEKIDFTENYIKERMKDKNAEILSIGPAGENLILFSSIMTDSHRAAGRGGGGAVIGSKNLKAIAAAGSISISVADPNKLKETSKKVIKQLKAEPFTSGLLSPFGTPGFYTSISGTGTLPNKNWQRTTYPESHEVLGHEAYHNTLDVKPYACAQCAISCGRKTTIKSGHYAGESGGGPEYETLGAFGSKCLINDLNTVAKAGYLCNELGLDTISAGQVIATAMEWYERGIIDDKKADGLKLEWGNANAVLKLIEKIAYRDGFGDLLAEGSKKAAEKLGGDAIDYAFQVKGLEMASCGVRASKGEAVAHAVSPRGADHLRPYASVIDAFGYIEEELGINEKKNPVEDDNKKWIKPLQELSMTTNIMGACLFASICLAVKPITWSDMLNAVTGEKRTVKDLLKAGERVINLERIINKKFGFDRKDDKLPKRLLTEPAPDGVGKGEVVNLEVALDSYYEAMGWNKTDGIPTLKKLEELNLLWVA
ncbi:MAG: aldehyde ferredoxin oxidoreductase family protein [Deltaproteobacteria bacterium]|nr:aldehyde ferredoxin oxidoreductase family protein [Deltaproteobacteria bacterium]